ncbi:hypothetical protein [Flavobacterium commune]|uniref:Peptide-N(4)-(N-acetyl-beta-glucosaminyl)asparagine amidase n=1 Tax=Flavobacterium commune TaxID=1306519 RepID=A0A1D9PCQ9_9FLAO|nr:hypothetical protein [Flavobacterium commune]APA00342.1 hypothetical protein BIW12_13410 [Flavobacterium commune]
MTKQRLLYIFILSGLMFSCNNDATDKQPDYWLSKSSNEFPKDSSYLERATVLSGNMKSLLNFVGTLDGIKRKNTILTKENLDSIANLLAKSFKISENEKPYLILDKKYITKAKILHNNQLAYKGLLESNWKNTVSFKDYQEYILPYKLTNEIYDSWRDSLYLSHQKLIVSSPVLKNLDSLYKFHTSKTYNSLSSKVSMRMLFPSEENYSWMNLTKEGDCVSRCRYAIYHLRAAGVPATYDYIPNWGNRPFSRHAYVGLANKENQVPKLLENNNDPKNMVDNLNAAMSPKKMKIFKTKELPKGLYVEYEKTIPKIYRQTWTTQAEMKGLLSKMPSEELFRDLIKPNMIDVTAQYLQTTIVTTNKSLFENKSMAYLATFDTNDWTPVAFTTFNWYGKATFKDVGKNIVYLPMTYNGTLNAYENPFILDNSGIKKELICNKDKRISMKLIRKFPLFSYTAAHSEDLKECRIEGANDPDFKDAKLLHVVNGLVFSTKQVDFKKPDSFRYIKMVAPEGGKLRLAEIECFSNNNGALKKVEDVNYLKGILEGQKGNAFDGDFSNYLVGGGVKLDFGTSVPISKIRYTPMNDSNYVIPNYEYELFYWDNGWVSAGKKIADNDYINYSNIPSGTIYWLRCLTAGKEERIFTYENGVQIWW